MNQTLLVREAQRADYPAIYQLVQEAFANQPYSRQAEPLIVERLRQSGQLTVSLLAQTPTRLLGYVAFSPVTITTREPGWYGLRPVAVSPAYQRNGIGRALIRQGLARLQASQATGCVVTGNPGYYGQFGFEHAPGLVAEGIPPRLFYGFVTEGGWAACGERLL